MILSTISLTIKLNVNIELLFIFHGELDKKLNAIFVRKVRLWNISSGNDFFFFF